jgi:hypothetical protein
MLYVHVKCRKVKIYDSYFMHIKNIIFKRNDLNIIRYLTELTDVYLPTNCMAQISSPKTRLLISSIDSHSWM